MTVLRGWRYGLVCVGILIVLGLLIACTAEAKPRSNEEITLSLAGKYKKPIVLFDGNKTPAKQARKLLLKRKNKYVLIEKLVSRSNGKRYGIINGKWIIAYNKVVPKGKRVVSYIIYNPYTDYEDDSAYVIDNGKWR